MGALARVRVFIEMGAIELGEAVGVTREMRGSPVENDSDAGLVTTIHKLHEFGGCAEAAGGGIVAKSLIPPGAVIGMFHDGKQLDVRVAEIHDVGDELVAELVVAEPAIVILRDAPPGAEVDFVDGDG